MIIKKIRLTAALTAILSLFLLLSTAPAESIGPDLLLKGECVFPLTVSISSPQYKIYDRFGAERREDLNRLLKHLAISVTTDGNISETAVLVDQEPVWSSITENGHAVIYSFDPDIIRSTAEEPEQNGEYSFIPFLENPFFMINRLLDDLYPLFEKSAEVFQQYARSASAALTFKGYGKGVRRITIPVPEQSARESISGILADLTQSEECRLFLKNMVFSGVQKITLLYDQDDCLIRITYDGIAGYSEESLKKVSLQWRCLRKQDLIKDNLSMKMPFRSGSDRYNFTYEREVNRTDPLRHTLLSDLQIDRKEGKTKRKTAFRAEFTYEDLSFTGKASLSVTEDGEEHMTTVVPTLKKENEAEYSGTIEINHYSGKIVTSSIGSDILVSTCSKTDLSDSFSEYTSGSQTENEVAGNASAQDQMNRLLIRRLLTLPGEDLVFLRKDIPDDAWNALVQSLN